MGVPFYGRSILHGWFFGCLPCNGLIVLRYCSIIFYVAGVILYVLSLCSYFNSANGLYLNGTSHVFLFFFQHYLSLSLESSTVRYIVLLKRI
jgi:hypothetical protein